MVSDMWREFRPVSRNGDALTIRAVENSAQIYLSKKVSSVELLLELLCWLVDLGFGRPNPEE